MKNTVLSIIILFSLTFNFKANSHVEHYAEFNYLEYELFRNNKSIGYHKYDFIRENDVLNVKSEVNFKIAKLGVDLYKYSAVSEEIYKNGKFFKSFRGMGSVGAMNKGSADRYSQKIQSDSSKYVAEGVEGYVKFKGKVDKIIYQLVGGLKSSMGYLGSKKVINLRNKASFIKITKAGFYESMVHNLDEIKK